MQKWQVFPLLSFCFPPEGFTSVWQEVHLALLQNTYDIEFCFKAEAAPRALLQSPRNIASYYKAEAALLSLFQSPSLIKII